MFAPRVTCLLCDMQLVSLIYSGSRAVQSTSTFSRRTQSVLCKHDTRSIASRIISCEWYHRYLSNGIARTVPYDDARHLCGNVHVDVVDSTTGCRRIISSRMTRRVGEHSSAERCLSRAAGTTAWRNTRTYSMQHQETSSDCRRCDCTASVKHEETQRVGDEQRCATTCNDETRTRNDNTRTESLVADCLRRTGGRARPVDSANDQLIATRAAMVTNVSGRLLHQQGCT